MQPVVATRKMTNLLKTFLKLINTSLSLLNIIFKSFSNMILSSNILLILKLTLPVVSTISIARLQSVDAT
jgi:hypothetical protein